MPHESRRGEANECKPGGGGKNNTRDNDARVDWTVRVPRGVLFSGRTVNGNVVARGLTAAAAACSVNGGITVETTGWATASTVNGSMSTDFPLTFRGKWGPKRMSGTIGEGGRTLSRSTGNGDMTLRKR